MPLPPQERRILLGHADLKASLGSRAARGTVTTMPRSPDALDASVNYLGAFGSVGIPPRRFTRTTALGPRSPRTTITPV